MVKMSPQRLASSVQTLGNRIVFFVRTDRHTSRKIENPKIWHCQRDVKVASFSDRGYIQLVDSIYNLSSCMKGSAAEGQENRNMDFTHLRFEIKRDSTRDSQVNPSDVSCHQTTELERSDVATTCKEIESVGTGEQLSVFLTIVTYTL
jgi:hypothetical protein